ncbi:hypothetical protein HAX54_027080 [Datura stramonium]|uniref:Uncharacterized protein n=1 Tax=Datura stramonium TaxID=4076 RepID=A0ABS8V3J7_DATST|nr:hypothetical protein [Datura stramonium]
MEESPKVEKKSLCSAKVSKKGETNCPWGKLVKDQVLPRSVQKEALNGAVSKGKCIITEVTEFYSSLSFTDDDEIVFVEVGRHWWSPTVSSFTEAQHRGTEEIERLTMLLARMMPKKVLKAALLEKQLVHYRIYKSGECFVEKGDNASLRKQLED